VTKYDVEYGFDVPELIDTEPVLGGGAPSTEETRKRYAFLKTKRQGETWYEGRFLYRMGPQGVTVFDTEKWG
jgi:hypothetical protein